MKENNPKASSLLFLSILYFLVRLPKLESLNQSLIPLISGLTLYLVFYAVLIKARLAKNVVTVLSVLLMGHPLLLGLSLFGIPTHWPSLYKVFIGGSPLFNFGALFISTGLFLVTKKNHLPENYYHNFLSVAVILNLSTIPQSLLSYYPSLLWQ